MAKTRRRKLYGFNERLEEALLASGKNKTQLAREMGFRRGTIYNT